MEEIFNRIWNKRLEFLGTFFLVFTLSYIVLMAFDFLPEKPTLEKLEAVKTESALETNEEVIIESENDFSPTEVTPREVIDTEVLIQSENELPVSIYIEKLDKNIKVNNPNSRAIADLDNSLLTGAVRHPDSATLNQEGNVFVLGHSSYLPTVINKNFQAFNGIQNLEWGDKIYVYSDKNQYQYRVEKVFRAKAQDVTVPIANTGNMLTLATCNSFGSTDDRYIVEAKLINVSAL